MKQKRPSTKKKVTVSWFELEEERQEGLEQKTP